MKFLIALISLTIVCCEFESKCKGNAACEEVILKFIIKISVQSVGFVIMEIVKI